MPHEEEKLYLYLGILQPGQDVVLVALQEAYKLLDSVAFVRHEGDTDKALLLLAEAIKKVNSGKIIY